MAKVQRGMREQSSAQGTASPSGCWEGRMCVGK